MGVVADIERELAQARCRVRDDDMPELRTSTMTHLVWAPQRWLGAARQTLAALEERHPARTIFLVPEPARRDGIEASATVRDFELGGGREVISEVVEVRLRGRTAEHPASIVLPLLISDLPAFCRWRGEPDWHGTAFAEIADVVDRLVVDSSEWPGLPESYAELDDLFDQVAVSDIAWRRGLPWRERTAGLWPGVRRAATLRVHGPRADALLLAGWLRTRLRREVELEHRGARVIRTVAVDGVRVEPPLGDPPSPGELLSAELEVLARDRIYEAAVRAAGV